MIIRFRKALAVPAAELYAYFRSPADWVRLYDFAGEDEVFLQRQRRDPARGQGQRDHGRAGQPTVE